MLEYIVNHWQGLLMAAGVFLGIPSLFIIPILVMELLDHAYCKGYDKAWNAAVEAVNNGHMIR